MARHDGQLSLCCLLSQHGRHHISRPLTYKVSRTPASRFGGAPSRVANQPHTKTTPAAGDATHLLQVVCDLTTSFRYRASGRIEERLVGVQAWSMALSRLRVTSRPFRASSHKVCEHGLRGVQIPGGRSLAVKLSEAKSGRSLFGRSSHALPASSLALVSSKSNIHV